MAENLCHVPVSIGELFDKYTILQIKKERITQEHKLIMVKRIGIFKNIYRQVSSGTRVSE